MKQYRKNYISYIVTKLKLIHFKCIELYWHIYFKLIVLSIFVSVLHANKNLIIYTFYNTI